ncbi:MAG: hypothetical protein ACTH3E_09845 [Psychroflexus halocasei]
MQKLKSIYVSFLVLLISFNSLKSGFMLSFYMVDTKEFVELFCVNKDQPELHCDGKCELSKLAQQNSSDEKPSHLDFLQKEIIMFYSEISSIDFKTEDFYLKIDSSYVNLYHYQLVKDLNYPPIIS